MISTTGANRWEEAKAAYTKALEIDPTARRREGSSRNALQMPS